MSFIRHFCQRFVFLIISCSLPAIAAPAIPGVTARIRIMDDYMIVVPVTINGSGPYDLLLDTGSNNTMLDEKLADELALRRGHEDAVVRVWGSLATSAVYAESFSIAGATVAGKDLTLFTCAMIPGLPPKLRGILGEDFLQKFDILIDYKHQLIRLDPPPGLMSEMLKGERLTIQLNGMISGEPTFGRLVVTGRVGDLGTSSMSLLLDSGSRYLTLFRDDLGLGSAREIVMDSSRPPGSSKAIRLETRTVRSLMLGRTEISNILVIAVAGKQRPDVDGLMPTSLFRSIFISHQGRFVVLNPSFSRTLAADRSNGLARATAIPPDFTEPLPQTSR